ncbi:helix-turn-helix domain-containing protein [Brevundimonas sp. NPDC055300]
MKALPPMFGAETPTDAYELLLGIARPLRVARDPSIHGRVKLDLLDVARACRYLLDHPRSHWDLHQQGGEVVSAFRARLEAQLRFSQRPVVRSDLVRVLQYGWPRKSTVDPGWEAEWVSVTEAAAILRLERRKVRSLIDAGLLHEDSKLGGQHRMHSSLQRVNVDRLRGELMAQMPLREFQSRTGLSRSAVEQLLGLGLLAETTSAATKLVYQGFHIERESAEALLDGLAAASDVEPGEGDVPIWEVMRGVGGRRKPWARLLRAALDGKLPGGLRGARGSKITDLTLHPVTARHLVMGGVEAGHPFEFQAGDLGQWERSDMASCEVEEYLNCTAQDVCWLRQRKYLQSLSAKGEVAQYARHEVETLGRRMITTREVAARIGKPPAKLWPELQAFSVGGSLGQGFYERALIEPWMAPA